MKAPDLTTIPERMKQLVLDSRGFPVPWFVHWVNDEPEFRAMDTGKFSRAVKERLCWVCGSKLGVNICFVAGPMCGINRTSAEPPSHYDCALWSAQNCPFLNNPRMVRRQDELLNNARFFEEGAGFGISRNPGVTMLWVTRSFEIYKARNGYLFTMGEPERVEWLHCGRTATRAEIQESIDTGLPALRMVAEQQEGGIEHLMKYIRRLEKWLPAGSEPDATS